MRKSGMIVCLAVLGLASTGCLKQALLNLDVALGRADGYISMYPDEAETVANWFQDKLDDLTAEE